jgi:hypothetical protein
MTHSCVTGRSVVRIAALLACVWVLAGAIAAGQAASTATLQEAIADGRVIAVFRGTGASSGDAVTVEVSRTPRAGLAPLSLTVEPGSMLRSTNGSSQNMVATAVRGRVLGGGMFRPAARIEVPASGTATYLLAAYCAEFRKDNPSTTDTFVLEPPDAVLSCVAEQGRSLTIAARQAAVWILTDRLTYADMRAKFAVSPDEWAAGQSVANTCGRTIRMHPSRWLLRSSARDASTRAAREMER